MMAMAAKWCCPDSLQGIRGILLDISGVLYDSGPGGGVAIPGSIQAVSRLISCGVPVRFCTNETQCTRQAIAEKLNKLGFNISSDRVFPPAPAVCQLLKLRALRPHLLVFPDVLPEFAQIPQENPNCVVLGDAARYFTYENVNAAFRVLMALEKPVLISMGRGKYYKETSGLALDVGGYMKALEYSCGISAEIVGKPDAAFFMGAVTDMGMQAENVLMIGDDIVNDIGGAQKCGMLGVLVRTGKYRPSDERHEEVQPDGTVSNLAEAVDLFLKGKNM